MRSIVFLLLLLTAAACTDVPSWSGDAPVKPGFSPDRALALRDSLSDQAAPGSFVAMLSEPAAHVAPQDSSLRQTVRGVASYALQRPTATQPVALRFVLERPEGGQINLQWISDAPDSTALLAALAEGGHVVEEVPNAHAGTVRAVLQVGRRQYTSTRGQLHVEQGPEGRIRGTFSFRLHSPDYEGEEGVDLVGAFDATPRTKG